MATMNSFVIHFESERGPREWVDEPNMTVAEFKAFAKDKK